MCSVFYTKDASKPMARPVFISYARDSSTREATALAERLGEEAFIDTRGIADGEPFPQALIEAVLGARVVIVFATRDYASRRYCLLELRLALAAAASASIVLALGDGAHEVLELLPPEIALRNWPPAAQTGRLADLIQGRLASSVAAVGSALDPDYARRLANSFLEEAALPVPKGLPAATSLPSGVLDRSIGTRFVGRAQCLRALHRALAGPSGAARLTGKIAAGGGFGKTRLAVEYLHRYADCYPGGIFWIDAAGGDLRSQFWRVLRSLDPSVPDLPAFRRQQRDARVELESALRRLSLPALCVVDNIPETSPGERPRLLSEYFPAPSGGCCVTVLATSRQETQEPGVLSFSLDVLARESAVLLLTDNLIGAADLSWSEWETLAEWVGDLPLALDLLNRVLFFRSVSPRSLLERAITSGPTNVLDAQYKALRNHVPEGAIRGISEALYLSVAKLDETAQALAKVLAQLPAAPIPEAAIDALTHLVPAFQDARPVLRARHFVTAGSALVFGRMHAVMADFLCSLIAADTADVLADTAVAAFMLIMTEDRCRDPAHWPLMNLCRPHAETLFSRACASQDGRGVSLGERAASLRVAQGDIAGARELLDRALSLRSRTRGRAHPSVLSAENALVTLLVEQGEFAKARERQEKLVRTTVQHHGDEHEATIVAQSTLAEILRRTGDFAAAREIQEQIVAVSHRLDGPDHPRTLAFENNLAATLIAQGDFAAADRVSARVVAAHIDALGADHPRTLVSMSNLASVHRSRGDFAFARKLMEHVLAVRTRVLGAEHRDTVIAMDLVASLLRETNDLPGLPKRHERIVAVCRRVFGENDHNTIVAIGNHALTLVEIGDLSGAARLQAEAFELCRKVYGHDHPETLTGMFNLAVLLLQLGDRSKGIDLLIRSIAASKRLLGDQHPVTRVREEILATILTNGGLN